MLRPLGSVYLFTSCKFSLCIPGGAARHSGGSIYSYPGLHNMHNPVEVERFEGDLKRYLTRKIGLEAVMRVRCTKGRVTSAQSILQSVCPDPSSSLSVQCCTLRRYIVYFSLPSGSLTITVLCPAGLTIHSFHGNFFVRSTDLLSLPNINPDAGFGMQVAIEDNLTDSPYACMQAALLYTSSKGRHSHRCTCQL